MINVGLAPNHTVRQLNNSERLEHKITFVFRFFCLRWITTIGNGRFSSYQTSKVEKILKEDLEVDGSCLGDMVEENAIAMEMMRNIGMKKVKDQVFLMKELKRLVKIERLSEIPNPEFSG